MVGPPEGGRVYTHSLRPGLADCAPSGRIRLDALARWLQDVAYADVEDAGVAESAIWVVRRARMHVKRFPRFGSQVRAGHVLQRAGSDVGGATNHDHLRRRQRDRRRGGVAVGAPRSRGADVRLRSRRRSSRPTATRQRGGGSPPACAIPVRTGCRSASRGASAPPNATWPPTSTTPRTGCRWRRRSSGAGRPARRGRSGEILGGPDPDGIDVEIEYRTPAQPGEKVVLCNGARRWIVDEAGETHASILLARPSR